ncbi:MAG TPA: NUDIX domain-containing protein, partial [Caldimonas sp.]
RTQERYPVKGARAKRGQREHVWLWLCWRERVWLVRRPQQGVWAGLWSLPEFDALPAFEAASAHWPGQGVALASFKHVLTHLDWRLHPWRWTLPVKTAAKRIAEVTGAWPTGRWFMRDEALALGLPAPLRRLLSG